MKVYPNPNTGRFIVDLSNFTSEIDIMVFNSMGALVHKFSTQNEQIELDLLNEQRGIYFIRASSEQEHLVQKVVIQ